VCDLQRLIDLHPSVAFREMILDPLMLGLRFRTRPQGTTVELHKL
jgi:hypothetical protein